MIINSPPVSPAIQSNITPVGNTISVCSTTTLTLSAPIGFAEYLWSDGSTTQQITVTVSGTYSVAVASIAGCFSTSSDALIVTVIPAPCNNSAPVITPPQLSTTIGNQITIDLTTLISDADNNLVLSSIRIVTPPVNGAQASISNNILELDYTGLPFTGTDVLTLEACDVFGECVQQQFSIMVIGDIEIYNALSPNNDGKNDFFKIAFIEDLEPENTVTIYNRWGSKVFETENYTESNSFRGLNQNGNELPSGTYFYEIIFKSSGKKESGYLVLKR